MTDTTKRFPVERRREPNCAEDMVMIQSQMQFLVSELVELKEWQHEHETKSCTILAMQGDIARLIVGLRWLLLSVKIITWFGSATIGVLLFMHTILPLIHQGKQQ